MRILKIILLCLVLVASFGTILVSGAVLLGGKATLLTFPVFLLSIVLFMVLDKTLTK